MLVIETPRLFLREMTADDAPFILALLNEPSFHRYIGDRGVRTVSDAVTYMANGPQASYAKFGFGLWLVVGKDSGESMGICGVLKREALEHPDVGFAFRPAYWSQGFAREAAAASLEYARRVFGLGRIDAIVQPDNERSLRLLASLGFSQVGTIKLTPAGEDLLLLASQAVAGGAE
jgi:[ribosomal protein S5]-alanine N-acetyltransferase